MNGRGVWFDGERVPRTLFSEREQGLGRERKRKTLKAERGGGGGGGDCFPSFVYLSHAMAMIICAPAAAAPQ